MKAFCVRSYSAVYRSLLLCLCCGGLAASSLAVSKVEEASARIDALVENALREQGLQRQDLTDDATFVRRIYLDIVGRIPTYREVEAFEASDSPDKRAELIDSLLESPGYASHFYNYWEDVLRIKSRGRKTVMVSYQDWVKQTLSENMPYDEFVRKLVSSSGFVWDDPAVGYYLRDAGMPLDNMSNTAQVFLGTRMQCAQCHDHPFDRWTQQEYYHMAAFTFGVKSSVNGYRNIPEFEAFQEVARYVRRAQLKEGVPMDRSNRGGISPGERRMIRDVFEPLVTEVTVSDRKLKLPEDYSYNDAKPNQVMAPRTPFGPEAKVGRRDNAQEVYANWLTSPENPRFAKSIANRLWKKAMGVGLIEPVDDIKDDTVPSHPELMDYLETLMVESGFDMKAYLRAIFNSRTYQSYVSDREPEAGEPFYYTGPVLRRMTAEQLWDSVLTLAIPDLDASGREDPQLTNLRVREMEMKSHVENVKELDGRELYAIVKRLGSVQENYLDLEKEFQQKLNATDDRQAKAALRREFNEIRREKNEAVDTLLAKATGNEPFDRREMLAELSETEDDESYEGMDRRDAKRLQRVRRNLVRASEVVSPAPPGHFLREFGESDRDIIGSSTDEAAIPQALSLLNGNLFNLINGQQSLLVQEMQSAGGKRRLDVVFKSFYARPPSEQERELVAAQLEKHGLRKAYQQVLLALLNSQEFRFIQ
ncbi:DUF1549 domain-containing protein [Pelagicoccus sp. SDUM812005]|uniref:DUF1549 domain-containing protein n=1 Tax=Pelagicoccus sp. SDUM812005 TaxID=3041257 RepID=UPI00280DC7CD|nr:DUF1549 domain-containing protein [Pelagicoccus sp. SDUM812005]MDQ8180612.1 DUF1549 domain-containing protein [Pelagicoccus sp. SDUM812005]